MITNLKIGYNGRFGNQIFQFASLLGIADKIGCKAVIPTQNTNPVLQVTSEKKQFQARFELQDCFEIDESYFSNDVRVDNIKPELEFNFDESFFNISDFTCVYGYFQSDKYFKHIKDDLLNILNFKPHILEKAKKELFELVSILYIGGDVNKELVSLHVRRGDYAVPNPYHPVVSDIYLEKCIRYFSDEKYQFIVFSDDLEWCKQKWGNNNKFSFFSSDSHFVDFCAMTLCSHHIISNSSFSWWSSFLSKNTDKKVLAPEKWFGPGYANYITTDLYRDDMIVIDESLDSKIITQKNKLTMKIGLLIIATNKYVQFLQPLIESADDYFLSNQEVTYFIFTNKDINIKSNRNIVKVEIEHKEWPWMTLGRYKIFSNNSKELSKMDYLYYCDVDMRFVGDVGDEILEERVATQHPGYYERRGTPETNPDSLACVFPHEDMQYFAGGFNGGSSCEYLKMSNKISENIDIDYSRNIIAVWHDESHMNRYFLDNKPTKILTPSYCYGESMNIPFEKKIIALDKNHSEIRSE